MKTRLRVIIIVTSWYMVLSANIIRVPEDQPSIQAGINAAVNGDTVLVADSTYYENINFNGKAIAVASYYIIDGDTTHRDSTIINGSQPTNPNAASVVTFESGEDTTSVLYGFTITGGSGTWYSAYSARAGGGVSCDNSGCKIIANKIINNSVNGSVALGGGVAAVPMGSTSYLILEENQITQNMVSANIIWVQGGGVFLNSNARLTGNLISYNTCISDSMSTYTSYGGGISCFTLSSYPTLDIIMENNTISHNSIINYSNWANIPAAGGGVYIINCSGKMTGNKISYNEIWNYSNLDVGAVGVGVGATPDSFIVESNIICNNAYMQGAGDCYGGGIQVYAYGIISLINNLIEGNIATYGGGVVIANNILYPGMAILVNNTIINNSATFGGGIYVHESTAQVMNTIVWGNQAPTGAAIDTYNSSIDVVYSDVQGGWSGVENMNLNPEIVADSLSNTSPCIGSGIDVYYFSSGMICYCPSDGINGRMRPYPTGSNPDMGSWESKNSVPMEIEPKTIAGLPTLYSLDQNYPNPFNPITNIEFRIPNSEFVTLKIYDLLGQEVATLLSASLLPGSYRYEWDASGLASGVYLYRLEAGEYAEVRKMILMR